MKMKRKVLKMLKMYFEVFQGLAQENRKFEISEYKDRYILEEIEPPCNDRRPLASGDSVSELVDFCLNEII